MKVVKTVIETQKYLKSNSVGFVPTMGALHQGHLSLLKRAKEENEISVCSIFVNPTQFNNPEDLQKYPRTLDHDLEMLENAGCDVVFVPDVSEIYPAPVKLKFDFGRLERILEGEFRPGHFNGVGIVVSKLFNIVKPAKAYFGLKDIQQCAVINQLVKDLSFNVELVFCETVREKDGLAMSSRNVRLNSIAREQAPYLFKTLKNGKELLQSGASVAETLQIIKSEFNERPEFQLEYYEITDFETLESITTFKSTQKTAIILAAHLNGVRLIDNIVF